MSYFRNLRAGDYSLVERVRRVVANNLRKVVRRQTCCGHYGDPGC